MTCFNGKPKTLSLSKGHPLQAPHQRVVKGVRLVKQPWEYLLAKDQLSKRVAQFDQAHGPDGSLISPSRPERGLACEKMSRELVQPTSVPVTHLGIFGSCALHWSSFAFLSFPGSFCRLL